MKEWLYGCVVVPIVGILLLMVGIVAFWTAVGIVRIGSVVAGRIEKLIRG